LAINAMNAAMSVTNVEVLIDPSRIESCSTIRTV